MEWLLEYQLPFCDRDAPHWVGLAQKFDIAGKTKTVFFGIITYGGKLVSADWLRQMAFFLNYEGTFGNQEGITWFRLV